ncbi:MAG: 50S ribosomal protein L11 methyltransferase [Bacteroidota bacterium]
MMSAVHNHSDCLEVAFHSIPAGYSEILVAELSEIGFDSFHEEEFALLAFIREKDFNESLIREIIQKFPGLRTVVWRVSRIPDKNWNEIWESNYEPVLIAGKCYIRAPFHTPFEAMRHEPQATNQKHPATIVIARSVTTKQQQPIHDIIIEPKMSFGTAHHETTALMIEWLLEEEVNGKTVLDMGCGTGVLAILAHKMGAQTVVAIDNDKWAYENASENILKNNAGTIHVIQGDVQDIPGLPYDLILANINRNVLMEQIPVYAQHLTPGGIFFLSGFYTSDLPVIRERAKENGFRFIGTRIKNDWMAVKFSR